VIPWLRYFQSEKLVSDEYDLEERLEFISFSLICEREKKINIPTRERTTKWFSGQQSKIDFCCICEMIDKWQSIKSYKSVWTDETMMQEIRIDWMCV